MNDHPMSVAAGHAISLLAVIGTMLGYLPSLAAGAALAWYIVQIYESRTVQNYLHGPQHGRDRRKRHGRRAADKVEGDDGHKEPPEVPRGRSMGL